MAYFKHDRAMVAEGALIGEGTRIWANTNIQAGAEIGRNCNICDGSFVERGAIVGNNVTIKHHVSIFSGTTIEDNVFIASNIAFINDRNPRSGKKDWVLEKTTVKKGATIGTNSVLMCGLTIGEYALIGAGSVVTKDVSPYTIVVGNPAKKAGFACQCGKKLPPNLICDCGKRYSTFQEGLKFDG